MPQIDRLTVLIKDLTTSRTRVQSNTSPATPPNNSQSFQETVNEFVTLAAGRNNWTGITGVEDWQIRRAGMIGIVYGKVKAETMIPFQAHFMNLTRHDDLPVPKSND